jgi:hypothetical protein
LDVHRHRKERHHGGERRDESWTKRRRWQSGVLVKQSHLPEVLSLFEESKDHFPLLIVVQDNFQSSMFYKKERFSIFSHLDDHLIANKGFVLEKRQEHIVIFGFKSLKQPDFFQ